MSRYTNRLGWIIAAALGVFVVAALAGVVRGGPLDPPGAPAPTQPQVEPRSPIPPVGWDNTFPIVITQPGSYFLTKNLPSSFGAVSGKDAVQIQADDVTLDLNGFVLDGGGAGNAGISEGPASPPRKNWRISNGVIKNWPLGGIYAPNVSDSFFEDLRMSADGGTGISAALIGGGAVTLQDVTASSNLGYGIALGPLARVTDCFVDYAGANQLPIGIIAGDQSTITGCSTYGFPDGINVGSAATVSDCSVRATQFTSINTGNGATVSGCRTEGGLTGISLGADSIARDNFIASTGLCGINASAGSQLADNRILSALNGACLGGGGVTATRNTFRNISSSVFYGYSGSDVPAVVPAYQATDTYANVCYSPPGVCTTVP